MKTPKHIIISHVYSSDNKGDAALVSVLISDIKRKFPRATVTILTLEATPKTFEGVPQVQSFMSHALTKYHHPLIKLAYTFYMIGATLAWAKWHSIYLPRHLKEIAHLYEQADLIVPVGGGYLRSRKGLLNRLNVPLLLHPLLFGYLLKKPTVLYSQSVGPFQNKFEEQMVAFALRRMTRILLREDTSATLLAKLGVTDNTHRAIDSGFLLQSNHKTNIRKKYHIPKNALVVGVTVRSWLAGEAQARYELAVAKALDAFVETSNAHVIFIPQVTANKGDDDRITSRRVYSLMQHTRSATLINDTPNHHQIKAIYDNLDMLLGTRFHSVIFSLTSFVPVVAIEYEHKTSGIMHDLKLDEWVVKIEEVTSVKLTDLLHQLVHRQADYKNHLAVHLPPYVQKAQEAADALTENYAITE